ncbi:general odorant-binding protein 45-like [Toxorhynchites rutilus septentrionalis]|uniref:general odorant-binding protein 45-like n=1 Tax=Toxorhynchites rutilus septentrionalis TaxID=329112 RepID=UPI00247A63D9|nr:general odorant-binding protein 45-like [Toxorhynchites rutilus septentrionalis]
MNLLICSLVAAQALFATALLHRYEGWQSHFTYKLKSFRQSLDECAHYLEITPEEVSRFVALKFLTNQNKLKCLVRCAGINSGWWDDNAGIQGPVIENYFQPEYSDVGYHVRTQECLNLKVTTCEDDCSKAYESFLCYFHQYGTLKCSEEYIPLAPPEALQAAVDCINILQIPPELLEQYSAGDFPDSPATHCLFRCLYLAEGLYDRWYGLNLLRFYIRHHRYPSIEFLDANTKSCTNAALQEECDECARIYNARRCFADYGRPGYTNDILRGASSMVLGPSEIPISIEQMIIEEPLIEEEPIIPVHTDLLSYSDQEPFGKYRKRSPQYPSLAV